MNVHEPRNVSLNLKHNVEVQLVEVQKELFFNGDRGQRISIPSRASFNLKDDKYPLTFFVLRVLIDHVGETNNDTRGA